MSSYVTTYHTARFTAFIISFIGWLVFIGAFIALMINLSAISGHFRGAGNPLDLLFMLLSPWSIMISLSSLIIGLFMIAGGQIIRALVDNADNSGEILAILRENGLNVISDG